MRILIADDDRQILRACHDQQAKGCTARRHDQRGERPAGPVRPPPCRQGERHGGEEDDAEHLRDARVGHPRIDRAEPEVEKGEQRRFGDLDQQPREPHAHHLDSRRTFALRDVVVAHEVREAARPPQQEHGGDAERYQPGHQPQPRIG